MTQVITVSANTAAYAMEALKPQARVPSSMAAREAKRLAARQERDIGGVDTPLLTISSTEVALELLTMGNRQPQTGVRQAIESYEESADHTGSEE